MGKPVESYIQTCSIYCNINVSVTITKSKRFGNILHFLVVCMNHYKWSELPSRLLRREKGQWCVHSLSAGCLTARTLLFLNHVKIKQMAASSDALQQSLLNVFIFSMKFDMAGTKRRVPAVLAQDKIVSLCLFHAVGQGHSRLTSSRGENA